MRRLRLIYDGDCGFCKRSLGLVKRLDLFSSLDYVDYHEFENTAEFETSMVAVTPTGRSYRGFYAFRRLAWNLPLAWPVAPLLYLPGVAWVGERAYAWVAANRSRLA